MSGIARPAPLSSSTAKQKSVFEPGEIKMIQRQNIAKAERQLSYEDGLYANRASIMEANARSSPTTWQHCNDDDDEEEYEYETFGKPSTKVGRIGNKMGKLKKKLQRK